jgi:hypothetical protein
MSGWQQMGTLYAAWLALGCMAMWTVSRWSVRHRMHGATTAGVAAIALAPIAIVVLVLLVAATPTIRANLLVAELGKHEQAVMTLFFVWPFAAAFAAAQWLLRLSSSARIARWTSFATGSIVAGAAPLALLATGCRAAGACL